MCSSRACGFARLAGFVLVSCLLFSCGGGDSGGSQNTTGVTGSLVLVIDFEHKRFELVEGTVPLWSVPFFNADSTEVNSWVESFGKPDQSVPLAENILLRSKNLLTDSVIAIVADASGFDAHLLQRRIPARFILRWDDAALEVESSVSAGGPGLREVWHNARNTARRLFGESQMTVVVDSIAALTLQRAAVPPIATRVRLPKKR